MKKYAVRPVSNNKDALKSFSPLLQSLLISRGIETQEEANIFLNPDYDIHTHDPYLFADMEKAVLRVLKAIENKEKILIYSDYDADGIPGAVLFSDFFKKIGYSNVEVYIPHRHNEGYGLHLEAIDTFKDKGISLLITIDCGIVNNKEVEQAQLYGIDVIITDHHEPKEKLPPAYAVLNPKRSDCVYPEKMLCGSGVIFKFIQAILSKKDFGLKKGTEKWFLDMVGIATLSDMVPLTGENRVFAHFGLKVLRKSPRPGLQRLLRVLNINQRYLSEDDVGFMITPRINAASRMGHPQDAFNFLSEDDPVKAIASADYLNKINDERKGVVASIVKDIKKRIGSMTEGVRSVYVAGSMDWRPGVLGLAANSIAEEIKRPVFLWGQDGGEEIKGSCRSYGNVNLFGLMEKAKHAFIEFGGHKLAGGFSLTKDSIHTLEDDLVKACENVQDDGLNETVDLDREFDLHDVTWGTWNDIDKLSPFGIGNPKPLFIFKNVTPKAVKMFGKQKNHLDLSFEREMDKPVRAIGFFMNPEQFKNKPEAGKKCDLVATMEKSFWMNRPELRLRIVDIL